jgi:hypothetical protein
LYGQEHTSLPTRHFTCASLKLTDNVYSYVPTFPSYLHTSGRAGKITSGGRICGQSTRLFN